MTAATRAGALSNADVNWDAIDWHRANQVVRRLQARIVKAIQEKRWGKVKALQHLLAHSFSGKACAAITSDFEGKVQAQDMAGLRYSMDFPSRRKSKRKDVKLPMEVVTTGGESKEIAVVRDEYYPIIALPDFRPPAYVTKDEYNEGIEMVGYTTTPTKRSLEEIAKTHDAIEIATYTLRWPEAWARMFAKIAYATAVQQYGLDRLKEEDSRAQRLRMHLPRSVGLCLGLRARVPGSAREVDRGTQGEGTRVHPRSSRHPRVLCRSVPVREAG